MDEEIEQRIATLKRDIEALRDELRQAALREASAPASQSTYVISDKLDRLILEFMKVCDQVGGTDRR